MSDRSRPVSNILYRVYGADDQLLYVGATTNPSVRFQAHGWHTSWWNEASKITLEHCASLQALREAEAEAIRTESPRHNRIHARNRKPGPFRRRAFSSNEVAAGTTKVTASIHEQRNTHGTTYRVFWRDAGRQRTLSFPDLPDAQRFKDHLEQQGPAAALRAVSHG